MNDHPVEFICPTCGLDASQFVDGLVRQELGQIHTPVGVSVPVVLAGGASAPSGVLLSAAPESSNRSGVRFHKPQPGADPTAVRPSENPPSCLKHPGEVAIDKCYVCSKPICPKCMELFGFVCSPLCKAKAESHGLRIPAYEGQKSVIDARRWRKMVWVSTTAGAMIAMLAAFWGWYAWFGCAPKSVFSVRFADPAYSGQSAFAGKNNDQIVFLHGATLARYDLKSGK
jgi:hypothetical protein